MTAVAEAERLVAFAQRMLPRFAFVDLDRSDPIVLILLNRYRRQWGLKPGPVTGDGWRGVTMDGKLVLAFCDARHGRTVVVENVCPANSRYGRLAVYVVLLAYRKMYEDGLVDNLYCSVIPRNIAMQAALARVLGDIGAVDERGMPKPMALVFGLERG